MQMISRNLSIAKFYERRIAFTIPDWQRGEVWDLARQQWLIDSILRGLTLPKIYVAQNADGVFEVVDGQQRLAAIRLFLDGKISLSSVTMQELGIEGDGTFQSLSGEMAAAINAFTLQSDVITGADPEQVRELFLRLQHGMPLVTREKLNATHGNFRDYALALTKRTFFTVSVAFRDMRQAFLDVTSKVLATAVNGLKTSFRPRDMLALFEKHENFSVTSPLAQHIKATFEFCERAFPEKTEALRDRSYAQSVIMLASHLVANGKSDGQEASFARFVEAFNRERLDGAKITGGNKDWDYVEFRASSTSGTISDAVAVRHTIFLKKMATMAPELRARFTPHEGDNFWVPYDAADEPVVAKPAWRITMVAESFTINDMYAGRQQLHFPDWQRGEVWKKARQQLLLDSILRGWKLPKLYFNEMEGENEVVDGRQRLTAIFAFMDGSLNLSPATMAKFGLTSGKFSELPEDVARRFGNFRLEFDQISNATPSQLKDIFQRLQSGMALRSSEKLNAVSSKLRDFCVTLSAHEFFHTRLSLPAAHNAFFNIIARTAAYEIDHKDRYMNFQNIYSVLKDHAGFDTESAVAVNLGKTCDFLCVALPEKTPIRDGFFVQSMMTLAARFIQTGKSSGYEAEFGTFVKEFYKDFKNSKKRTATDLPLIFNFFGQTNTGNVVHVTRWSQEVLLLRMQQTHPEMAALFGEIEITLPIGQGQNADEPQPKRALGIIKFPKTTFSKSKIEVFQRLLDMKAALHAFVNETDLKDEPFTRLDAAAGVTNSRYILGGGGNFDVPTVAKVVTLTSALAPLLIKHRCHDSTKSKKDLRREFFTAARALEACLSYIRGTDWVEKNEIDGVQTAKLSRDDKDKIRPGRLIPAPAVPS